MSPEKKRQKRFGAFYTPDTVAEFLAKWAIRTKDDFVLDPGSGEGIFMKKAAERIQSLGLSPVSSKKHVFGIEYDKMPFEKLKKEFKGFNVVNSSFFKISPHTSIRNSFRVPLVDAVVGNPPYIERHRLVGAKSIQQKIIKSNLGLDHHAVTDVYVYFLIHASRFLKKNGRLAFIISDSWLNMNFGRALKEFLLRSYKITAIVGFEERVFEEALVRAVLILVENSPPKNNRVLFIRLRNHHDLGKVNSVLNKRKSTNKISVMDMEQRRLDPNDSWGVYLKASPQYFEIISDSTVTPLRELASVGIGIQTLKNDFHMFDAEKIEELQLEKEFFEQVILSPRVCPLVIKNKKEVKDFVLYCDKPSEIKNTKILKYIKKAEKVKVNQRGKTKTIIGVQNIPRIIYANRKPWYNLVPEIEKRCRGTIILPRRSFKRFFAAWNEAKVVVNDNFINIEPKNKSHLMPLLAILNSSFTEYLCRVRSQTYGGGVFDLRPRDVKNLPCLNLNEISKEILVELSNAYRKFIDSDGLDKSSIDHVIMNDILHLGKTKWENLEKERNSLMLLASISNGRSYSHEQKFLR